MADAVSSTSGGSSGRRAEVSQRIAEIDNRIQAACEASSRDRSEVGVVYVTKYAPVSDVEVLLSLGHQMCGENKAQSLRDRSALPALESIEWHFLGQLQRNKANMVARSAHVVHSVDSAPLIQALSRGALAAQRELGVYLQVSLDGDVSRGGCHEADVLKLAEAVALSEGLLLHGVMAVAPKEWDPRVAFERVQAVSGSLVQEHPNARGISAGMSGDFETAIACGATLLRIGGAVLGSRPVVG